MIEPGGHPLRNVRLYRLDDDGNLTGPPIEATGAFVEVHTPDPMPCVPLALDGVRRGPLEFSVTRQVDPALFRLITGAAWYRVDFDRLVAPRITHLGDLVASLRRRAAWFADAIRQALP